MKLNILITAAGGDIGGNIINILSEQKDKELFIVGTDLNKNIFALDKVDRFYQVERTDSLNYKKQILRIIEENSIEVVLPVSEQEILWFNENRNIFDALKIKVLINNRNIIDSFLNKLETSFELNNLSVKTPKTFLFSEFKNQLKFPLILKSMYSIKTKDIYIINNQNQLEYLKISIGSHDDYIIQQYIGSLDDEYTTSVYKNKNKFEVITFKRKLTGGMTSFATICNEEKLREYSLKIANSFNLEGSINIQSRKVGNDFYIFEINPRFSSTVYVRNYFGFKDVLWWINDINDGNIFNIEQNNIDLNGSAILGYQYKFFNQENK
ncbi:MAG: ATP-grasp domain-containing protein [Sulfurimonas sp.]|nr:ATP-grasp domain-containing protein [Sulfurimonas sp.]